MRRRKWHQNYPIWTLFWVIETKTWIRVFVSITQNNVQLDNFGVILFVSFIYKKLLQYSFYENWKNRCKNHFSAKNSKKLCITTKSLYTNSNFKRNYLENYNDSEVVVKTKNAPFFMIFPNISFFLMIVNYWTGPLNERGDVEFSIYNK